MRLGVLFYFLLVSETFSATAATHDKPVKPTPYLPFMNTHYQARFISHPYHNEVIAEALRHAQSALGNFTSQPTNENIPNLRIMEEVIKGETINVVWGPALTDYNRPELFTIDIPLLKGIAGCHVLLIRKDEQSKFSNLSSLQDITFGLDHSWAEQRIFTHNNLPFMTTMGVDALFLTLNAKRNDAIPFGAHRVLNQLEASRAQTDALALETSLVIYYPMPILYYVNNKHPALADALERGLKALQKNGRLHELFVSHYQTAYNKLNLGQRKIFTLENPLLRENAPDLKSPCSLHSNQA